MKRLLKTKLPVIIVLLLMLAICFASCEKAVSVIGATINENGELILSMSDDTTQNLGKVKGERGADGKDGEDGEDGKDGKDGKDGEDGKNAILPEIVEENPQGLAFYLLPDDTYTVSIGDAYYLREITIPATYKGKPVTCIGTPWDSSWLNEANLCYAGFFGAPYLTKITIPDSIKIIGEQAFSECAQLSTVVFLEGSKLSSIGKKAFYDCDLLWNISLPNRLTLISESAFENCVSLMDLDIPDSVMIIGEKAFYNCSDLVKSENKLDYVDTWLVSADTDIVTATLRSDTTAIADEAFAGCRELENLYIPSGVVNIGRAVFNDTRKIETIIVETGNQMYHSRDNKLYDKTGKLIAPLADGVIADPF